MVPIGRPSTALSLESGPPPGYGQGRWGDSYGLGSGVLGQCNCWASHSGGTE